jgi:hypothetical protein
MAPKAGSAGAGRQRLLVAAVIGVALAGALLALQLVDDGDDNVARSSDRTVRVKDVSSSRPASLVGHFDGADGFTIEVLVISPDGEARATADPDGRYRVTGLAQGPVEISWVGSTITDAGAGVSLGAQRSGRTQIVLDAGRNRVDLDL